MRPIRVTSLITDSAQWPAVSEYSGAAFPTLTVALAWRKPAVAVTCAEPMPTPTSEPSDPTDTTPGSEEFHTKLSALSVGAV